MNEHMEKIIRVTNKSNCFRGTVTTASCLTCAILKLKTNPAQTVGITPKHGLEIHILRSKVMISDEK